MMGRLAFIFLALFIGIFLFESFLKLLNLRHLRKYGDEIPQAFEGVIDGELLTRTKNYILEHSYFGFFESIFDLVIIALFIFGGILKLYDSWILSLDLPFIAAGIVFFLLLSLASTVLSIPFSIYSNFKIENKYGFNTMTYTLWIQDLLKSLSLSVILTSAMVAAGCLIILASPGFWWLWLWIFFLGFGIFMMYISPYVIEPLFHKFTPVQEESLEQAIRSLMERVKIRISRILVVDASKRSRHTNAYFTGIGKVKRIVLFDNLLKSMSREEILAVLAHEAGHWRRKHVLKRIVIIELFSLAGLSISYRVLQSDILLSLFAIHGGSFFAKVVLLGFIGNIVLFFFKPLGSFLSRRGETQADEFASRLIENREDLVHALVKLSKDNLSNLHPHPVYAFFYYSHPPIQERLKKILDFP